jgi:hypothetical protein
MLQGALVSEHQKAHERWKSGQGVAQFVHDVIEKPQSLSSVPELPH